MSRSVETIRIEEILKKGERIIAENGNEYELLETATCKESYGLRIYRVERLLDVNKDEIYFLKCAYLSNYKGVGNLERENKFQFYYPFIEHVIDSFYAEDYTGNSLYCVLFEYIDGLNLREYWENMEILMQDGEVEEEEFRRKIFGQMIQFLYGVNYYIKFSRNDPYLHRDLKPDNIMITEEGNVVIVDFDIAHVSGSMDTQMCIIGNERRGDDSDEMINIERQVKKERMLGGTGGYSAPEMYISIQNGTPEMPNVKSEIYSIGRLFFYWIQGKDYFEKEEYSAWYYNCNNNEKLVYGLEESRFKNKKYLSKDYTELLNVIKRMCTKPEERYDNIEDVFRDIKNFLIRYCGNSEKKYEEYIRRDQMMLLWENSRNKSENAPNVIYEVCTPKEKYIKGRPLRDHTMRDISIQEKLVMIIYNLNGIISYIPYDKQLYRIRQEIDYEIHPNERFMLGDIRIKFYIH